MSDDRCTPLIRDSASGSLYLGVKSAIVAGRQREDPSDTHQSAAGQFAVQADRQVGDARRRRRRGWAGQHIAASVNRTNVTTANTAVTTWIVSNRLIAILLLL